MIKNIEIIDEKTKDILLFNKIEGIKPINILFGGNGVGKTTFINAIKDNKVRIEGDKDFIIKAYTNSFDNVRNNQNKQLDNRRDFVKAINAKSFSEGQAIIHYVLSFLYDIKEMNTEKDIIVLLDEVDSGLSVENINMLLWQIKEIVESKNVFFFISSNHYHFTKAIRNVLSMYDGKYITINNYEEYFNLLQDGIGIMKNSNKRNFNFLDIY